MGESIRWLLDEYEQRDIRCIPKVREVAMRQTRLIRLDHSTGKTLGEKLRNPPASG